MTAAPQLRFEDAWPDLAAAVRSMLSAKRVPDSAHDDIVQETGLRLLAMWNEVEGPGVPKGLAVTIALNLARDDARRVSAHLSDATVPDAPSLVDVERSGLARIELQRVHRALGSLKPEHRSALLTEIDHRFKLPYTSPGAQRALRFRARRNLQGLLDRLNHAIAPRIASAGGAIRRLTETVATRDSTDVAAAGLATLAALSLTFAPFPPTTEVPSASLPALPSIERPNAVSPRRGPVPVGLSEPKLVLADVSKPQIETDAIDNLGAAEPDTRVETGTVESAVDEVVELADASLNAGERVAEVPLPSLGTDGRAVPEIPAPVDDLTSTTTETVTGLLSP